MRTPSLVVAAAAAALLPAFAVTSPAPAAPAAKAVKVTITNLPASSDVGEKVKVTGKIAGTRSDKVTVLVQRRYVGGDWRTVGKDTTDKKGRYSLKVPLAQGGPTSFRAKVGTAKSPVESLAVYAWLDLVDQSLLTGATSAVELRRTATIGGRALRDSVLGAAGDLSVAAKPNGLCTTFEMWSGFLDEDAAGQLETARQEGGISAFAAGEPLTKQFSVPVGPAVRQTLAITGSRYLYVQLQTAQAEDAAAVLGTPRLRCNATSLPEITYEEFSA